MIHTIEISYIISMDEFLFLAPDIFTFPNLDRAKLDSFLKYEATSLAIPSLPTGISHLVFIHNKELASTVHLKIVLDLQALLYGSATIDLFTPTHENTTSICYAYAEAILTLFPSLAELTLSMDRYLTNDIMAPNASLEALPYLILAKVCRIDYSLNLLVDEADKELSLRLIKFSYYNTKKKVQNYKKNVGRYKNYNLYAKSSAKKASSTTKVYDKLRYYDDKDIAITDTLRQQAENILRYEYEKSNDLKRFIANNYDLPKSFLTSPYLLSPVTFFDCDTCYKILLAAYAKEIGLEDWYADYQYKKAVNESHLTAHKKKTILNDIAPLISQCRSIESASSAYVNGYTLAKTKKKIKGSASTFKNYLTEIHSIGIQPLRIPDKAKETHLTNPINMIHSSKQKVNRNFNIPAHIKANIDRLLQHIWLNELNRKCGQVQKAS